MEKERLWPGGPVFFQAEHVKLTTDSILLADFTPVRPGDRGVDLGCASGALMLLLLWKEPTARMTGLELQPEAAELAGMSFEANGLRERTEVRCGDLRETVKQLPSGGFDFVVSNPPYFAVGQGASAKSPDRAAARTEAMLTLQELCHAASRLCRSGGRVCFAYRPDRLETLLEAMHEAHLEPKRLRFVHHSASTDAFLVLCEGRKDGRPGLKVEPPFLLHDSSGEESDAYRAICHRE